MFWQISTGYLFLSSERTKRPRTKGLAVLSFPTPDLQGDYVTYKETQEKLNIDLQGEARLASLQVGPLYGS